MSTNKHSNRPQTAAAPAAAPSAAAPAKAKRESRLPIEAVREALSGQEIVVKELADKLKIGERDVRLSIDTLRRKGVNVVRSALKTFTIPKAAAK